jgi:hypothetical protein
MPFNEQLGQAVQFNYPVIHIRYSVASKFFFASLGLSAGAVLALLILKFPYLSIPFGFPVLLIIYLGLRHLWQLVRSSVKPQVVLGGIGLENRDMSCLIRWEDIDSTSVSSTPQGISLVNLHLKDLTKYPQIDQSWLTVILGKFLGFQSPCFIRTSELAISGRDLKNLIDRYRINPHLIDTNRLEVLTDRGMPKYYIWYQYVLGLLAWAMVFWFFSKWF